MAKLTSDESKLIHALWNANLAPKLISFLENKLALYDKQLRSANTENFRWIQGRAQELAELINTINVDNKST